MAPRWLELIQALPGHPEIAYENLTIVFLIGGTRTSFESRVTAAEVARKELFSLLNSFVDYTPEEHVLSIRRCADINQPVVRLLPSGYTCSPHGLDSLVQRRRTVFLDPEFTIGCQPSVSSLANYLFQELEAAICTGCFSFDRGSGKYRPLTDEECHFIEGSIGL